MSNWKRKAFELAINSDLSWREIAKTVGAPKSTVSDYLRAKQNEIDSIHQRQKNGAKVLLYDIETAPACVLTFGRFKQHITEEKVLEEGYMLSWSAQWLDSGTIMSEKISDHKSFKKNPHDDAALVKSLWKLIDEADILVAHNNDFDEKTFNTRAIYHGCQPPHPSKRICTYKLSKGKFNFPSNSLKSLAHYLGLTNKIENEGFRLWRDCWHGDEKALETMQDYNIGDIVTLRELYLKVGAWDDRSPNLALFSDLNEETCGHCGSQNMKETGKYTITGVSKFETVRCKDCGKVSRRRVSVIPKHKRSSILMNISR